MQRTQKVLHSLLHTSHMLHSLQNTQHCFCVVCKPCKVYCMSCRAFCKLYKVCCKTEFSASQSQNKDLLRATKVFCKLYNNAELSADYARPSVSQRGLLQVTKIFCNSCNRAGRHLLQATHGLLQAMQHTQSLLRTMQSLLRVMQYMQSLLQAIQRCCKPSKVRSKLYRVAASQAKFAASYTESSAFSAVRLRPL